jgi:amino acid transporter
MSEPNPRDEPQPTEPEGDDAPTSIRDNWWWSPSIGIVIGVVVVLFQVGPIRDTGGIWLNWVVAGLGIALAATSLARLVRAYPR